MDICTSNAIKSPGIIKTGARKKRRSDIGYEPLPVDLSTEKKFRLFCLTQHISFYYRIRQRENWRGFKEAKSAFKSVSELSDDIQEPFLDMSYIQERSNFL